MYTRFLILVTCSIALFFKSTDCQAQENSYYNYIPLKCYGPTPEDFLKPSFQKYNSEAADITKNREGSKKDRKLQKEFSLVTNYKIDEILMSGKVQFGNKVSDYINAVAAKLLVNEPTLKGKMRFYLFDVPYANAFATNNGIVMVTTGLIAQLENEAQLAFVLSHEISHFKLGHSFESYKKTKDILASKKYDDLGTDEKIVKILKYSKDHESEADIEGLKIFAKAGYDKNESLKMMDILLYSYLPFDEIPFSKQYFNDSFYKIPLNYFPDSAAEITAVEDEDDEDNSHPNIEFRKSNLEKYIKQEDKGGLNFLGVEKFDDIVKTCRYELGYLLMVRGNYSKAFYNAYLLSQLYGESPYTAELMIGSLYGINKWKLAVSRYEDDDESKSDDKSYEGEISLPYHLFSVMKQDEFNVLAAKTIAKLHKKFNTEYSYKVVSDVFTDLLYAHKYELLDFNTKAATIEQEKVEAPDSNVESNNSTVKKTETIATKSSKVKKIKRYKKISVASSNSRYYKNAFVEEFRSIAFTSFLDSIAGIVKTLKTKEEDLGLSELRSEPGRRYKQFISDEVKIQKKKGKNLGIDSLLFIAPSYSAIYWDADEIEARGDNVIDEKKSIEITNYVKTCAKGLDLNLDLIDINNRTTLTSEQLNRYALVSNWINEKYMHLDKNDPIFSQKYVDTMIGEDGYKNVCLSGFTYKSVRRPFNGGTIFISFLLWPAAPLIIGHSIDTEKKLDYFSLVLDMKTGEQKMLIFHTIRRRPKAKVINLQIAYTLYQVKSTSKK